MINKELIGTWKCVDADFSVRITINVTNNQEVTVSGYDSYDDEELEITNVCVQSNEISFDCRVPSTGYFTKNTMKYVANGLVDYEVTLYERWTKIDVSKGSP